MSKEIDVVGFDWMYKDGEKVDCVCDLYIIGKFDKKGNHVGNVYSGRPSTIRVCESLEGCKPVIRAVKNRTDYTLKPIRLLTGVVVEDI